MVNEEGFDTSVMDGHAAFDRVSEVNSVLQAENLKLRLQIHALCACGAKAVKDLEYFLNYLQSSNLSHNKAYALSTVKKLQKDIDLITKTEATAETEASGSSTPLKQGVSAAEVLL